MHSSIIGIEFQGGHQRHRYEIYPIANIGNKKSINNPLPNLEKIGLAANSFFINGQDDKTPLVNGTMLNRRNNLSDIIKELHILS